MDDKLNFIREKCIEANPEIMDLDFGCEIETDNAAFGIKDFLPEAKCKAVVITYDKGGYNGQDFDGDTLTAWCSDWNKLQSWGDFTANDMPEYKKFGRPIRLADVLLAIRTSHAQNNTFSNDESIVCMLWNLRGDDLTQQSEKTIDSLYELLR